MYRDGHVSSNSLTHGGFYVSSDAYSFLILHVALLHFGHIRFFPNYNQTITNYGDIKHHKTPQGILSPVYLIYTLGVSFLSYIYRLILIYTLGISFLSYTYSLIHINVYIKEKYIAGKNKHNI